jgi:hypothetical protein
MKPRMKYDGYRYWICWGNHGVGVGKTMDEAWLDYHQAKAWLDKLKNEQT